MFAVPMKTHLLRLPALVLFVAIAAPAASGAAASDAERMARLEARIAALESRVAALEAGDAASSSGGQSLDRVAILAEQAVARLLDMVRQMKRNLSDAGS